MNGVTFGNKHSYTDFNMILTSRTIPLPEPKTYVIDVPCADGQIDLSTALTDGDIKYKNRKIKMKFSLLPSNTPVETAKSTIAQHLHGKTMQVIFDADSNFYYTGRCKITEFNTDHVPITMTVEMDADPYKFNITETSIQNTATSAGRTVNVPEQKMKVVPVINVSANMTLVYKAKNYSLLTGDNIIPDVVLSSGADNTLVFKGSGTFKIKFRGGEL